jgi:lipopolysaccharide export LptBFGC system permease protein LptF
MGQAPNPLNPQRLTRASLAGLGLAIGAIVLFVILWIALGNARVDQFPRLIISLCVPPAFIALAVGIYFLLVQPRSGR